MCQLDDINDNRFDERKNITVIIIIFYRWIEEDDDHTDMPSVLINIPAKRPSLRNLLTRQRSRRHSTLRKFLPPPQRGGKTRKNKTVHNV